MLHYGRGTHKPGGSSEYSCHPSGAWNFEVDLRFLENFCTPTLRPSSHLHPAGGKTQGEGVKKSELIKRIRRVRVHTRNVHRNLLRKMM